MPSLRDALTNTLNLLCPTLSFTERLHAQQRQSPQWDGSRYNSLNQSNTLPQKPGPALDYQDSSGDSPLKTLIHPTAVIHPKSELHHTVQVGAYAVIGAHVKVGPETIIGAHAVLEGPCEIGAQNQIFTGAAIGMEPQDLKFVGEPTWVKIGDHNLIREYVTINRATGAGEATIIGDGNLLMAYVHVAHNCVIEDQVVIANSVALAGHVHIESRARLSGVLGVHQFVRIGRQAMVGGMARIDRDVAPYMLVEGNPARVRTLNLVGLKRSGMESVDLQMLKKAFRILYRSDLSFKDALEQLELLGDSEELQHLRRFLLLSQMPGRRGLIPGKGKKGVSDES